MRRKYSQVGFQISSNHLVLPSTTSFLSLPHFPVDFYYLFLLQSCLGESRSLEPKSYVTVPSFLADLRFRSSEMTRFNLRIFRGELSARSVSGE